MIILFLSGGELFIAMVVVLLLFGAKKIPEMARGLGRGMQEFRKATDEIKKEINENAGDITKEFKDVKSEVEEFKNELK